MSNRILAKISGFSNLLIFFLEIVFMIYQLFFNKRRLLITALVSGGLLLTFNAWSLDWDCKLEQLGTKKTTGIFYQIKTKERPTSFLFGTMHIGTPKFSELPIAVKTAISQSRIYLTESPIGNEARENVKFMTNLEEGQTLSAILRPDVYEKYQAWLNRLKVPKETQLKMEGWHPTLIIGFLYKNPSETEGLERLDVAMLRLATSQSLEIRSVENSIEWRHGRKSMTNEDWSNLLNEILDEEKCLSCEKERLLYTRCTLELVRTGDTEGLFSLQEKFLSSRPGENIENEKTVGGRNQHQANNIDKLIQQQAKPMFFTVGAAHIGGPLGVVQRLRDMGYVVEQIKE
jgi:uncharacterized protein YbaP (TraB family)